MSKHNVRILPLTAVHIGTGEELGPLNYIIGQNKKGERKYYRFSSERIASSFSGEDYAAFAEAVDQDNMIRLRKLFQKNINRNNALMYASFVTAEVVDAYDTKFSDPNNQLLVHEMYRTGKKHEPVLPGSSLKGAIRTAVLNSLAEAASYDELQHERKAGFLEAKLLNYNFKKIAEDPFRGLRVSDGTVSGGSTQLVAKIYNYRPHEANPSQRFLDKMQIFCETIAGQYCSGDSEITCTMEIDDRVFKKNKRTIIKNCYDFYSKILNDEYKSFYSSEPPIANVLEQIGEFIDKEAEKENVALIRIGRFSQRESMVIHKFAKRKQGISRMVAGYNNAYLPLGWCIMYIE